LAAELLPFVQKSKMADFIFVQYFGMHVCRTSNVIHLWNFVQICAIVNELWTIDEIQNGGRHHLEFIIFVDFSQMVYFRWQPSTLLQKFIHLRQSVAELLLFVKNPRWRPLPSWISFLFNILACVYVGPQKRNIYAKFGTNTCNNKHVMSDKLNSKWRLSPSWIYYFCSFWSNVPFPVAALYIAAKFHSSTSIGSRVIAVCAKIQPPSWILFNCLIFWHTCM